MPEQQEFFARFASHPGHPNFSDGPDNDGDGGGVGNDPAFDNLPADIRGAIDLVSNGGFGARGENGGPADGNFFGAVSGGLGGSDRQGEYPGSFGPGGRPPAFPTSRSQKNFQERFLDSRDDVKTVAKVGDSYVRALDLTQEEDVEEYRRVMTEVYPRVLAEQGQWIYRRSDNQTFIDPASPRGFRVVTVIEYCRMEVTRGHDPEEFGSGKA